MKTFTTDLKKKGEKGGGERKIFNDKKRMFSFNLLS